MLEDYVYKQRRQKISDDQPSRPPRRAPKVEQFVDKQDQYEEAEREPFVTQHPWPVATRTEEAPRHIPREHKRAGQTKKVPRHQHYKDKRAAKVNPAQCCGQ